MFVFNKKRIITNKEKILYYLKKAIPSSKIKDNSIYLSKYNLKIKPKIKNIDDKDSAKIVDLFFEVKHELFMESYIESTNGIGVTIEEALKKCINNFLIGPFYNIENAIKSRYDECFETDFFGKKKTWKLFESPVQGRRYQETDKYINIWNDIGEEIKVRLGNKKIYWIKISISCFSNGEINSECCINGIYNTKIAECSNKYAEMWKLNGDIYMLQQYFLIKQDNETYTEYEFLEETVKEFTKKAIKVLGNCNSKEKQETLYSDIYKITRNRNLAYEIKKFIPEMLCELVFKNINYTDKIIVIKEAENETVKCYKNQLTNYYWIYNEVRKNYNNNIILEEEIKTIILLSSSYEAINAALNEEIKIDNLKDVGIIFHVCRDYVPT